MPRPRTRNWVSTLDPLMLLDRDGAVLAVNPAFEQTLGWQPGHLLERASWR